MNHLIFVLGIIAFLQVTFIPGFLILHLLHVNETRIMKLIYGFAISLMANYVIIFPLVALHLYVSETLFLLIIIELFIIFKKTITYSSLKYYLSIFKNKKNHSKWLFLRSQ